jgi:aminobenzoyl-glutamate transport protein
LSGVDRPSASGRDGLLDFIERLGNALPHPATLFLLGALAVMALSQLAVALGWEVEKTVTRELRAPVLDAAGAPVVDAATGEPVTRAVLDPATGAPARETLRVPVRPVGLLEPDGLFWCVKSMVDNFKNFPPLAIVLVGMLGIGLAERAGLVGALLKASLQRVPPALLTPALLFVGINSSLALDAGYVVLPPIAAALYHAAGRSPLVGLAAVFAGVAGGFSANLFLSGLEPLLAGFTESGARILDAGYRVAPTCNWWFGIASTFLLTAVGWTVTARFVEPRMAGRPAHAGGPPGGAAAGGAPAPLDPDERRGLRFGLSALAATLTLVLLATLWPGAPFAGTDGRFPRWIAAIVPLLFLVFFVPGLAYGIGARRLRSDRDVAEQLGQTMAAMGPYVVLAFFAAQFVEYFRQSNLGEMLAIAGGEILVRAALPAPVLMVAFIAATAGVNLFIGSLSAKYAFLAPIFVPLFMQVGISPELTQAAYRVGDSVTNVVTPLNPYVVILLVLLQRYVPGAGVGTLVSLMLPYALAFGVAWSALLVAWMLVELPLGPAGPLAYP